MVCCLLICGLLLTDLLLQGNKDALLELEASSSVLVNAAEWCRAQQIAQKPAAGLPLEQLARCLSILLQPAVSSSAASLQTFAIPSLAGVLQHDPPTVLGALEHLVEFATFLAPGETLSKMSADSWQLRRKSLVAVAGMCKSCSHVLLPYCDQLRQSAHSMAAAARFTASEEAAFLESVLMVPTNTQLRFELPVVADSCTSCTRASGGFCGSFTGRPSQCVRFAQNR